MSNLKKYSFLVPTDEDVDLGGLTTEELRYIFNECFKGGVKKGGAVNASERAQALVPLMVGNWRAIGQLNSVMSAKDMRQEVLSPFTVDSELIKAGATVESGVAVNGAQPVKVTGRSGTVGLTKRICGFLDYTPLEIVKTRPQVAFSPQVANYCMYVGCFTRVVNSEVKTVFDETTAKQLQIQHVTPIGVAMFAQLVSKIFTTEEYPGKLSATGLDWAHFFYQIMMRIPDNLRTAAIAQATSVLFGASISAKNTAFREPIDKEREMLDEVGYPQVQRNFQSKPIASVLAKVTVTATNALAVLGYSRTFRGTDGNTMSGMSTGAYDNTLLSKAHAKIRDMAAVINAVDQAGTHKLVVVTSDQTTMRDLRVTFPKHTITFEGADVSIPLEHVVGKRKVVNKIGTVVFDLSAKAVAERKSTETIEDYSAMLGERAAAYLVDHINARAASVVIRHRLLDFNVQAVLDGLEIKGTVYYLADPSPHNMLATVVWVAPESKMSFRSITVDKFLEASIEANFMRNTYFLHRRNIGAAMDARGLVRLPLVSIRVAVLKAVDLIGVGDLLEGEGTFPAEDPAGVKTMAVREKKKNDNVIHSPAYIEKSKGKAKKRPVAKEISESDTDDDDDGEDGEGDGEDVQSKTGKLDQTGETYTM